MSSRSAVMEGRATWRQWAGLPMLALPTLLVSLDVFVIRGRVKTCGSAATLFLSPAVSLTTLTTLIFATVVAVANPRPGRRAQGVQRR